MNIDGRSKNGFSIIDIAGKINKLKDSSSLKLFIRKLQDEKKSHIALNLKEVTYLDSGALNALIFCHNALSRSEGKLVLIAPNQYVNDVLSVVGLDKIVTIYPSEEEFEHDTSTSA